MQILQGAVEGIYAAVMEPIDSLPILSYHMKLVLTTCICLPTLRFHFVMTSSLLMEEMSSMSISRILTG